MLMENIFIAILMSLAILPSMATQVNVRTKSTLPRGGARMPSITQVRADYEDGILTVNIQRYFGMVWVYIYDADGNVSGINVSNINGNGTIDTDVSSLPNGEYSIDIVLSDNTYTGNFAI